MIVDSAVYRNGSRVPVDCEPDRLPRPSGARRAATSDFVWVGLHEPTEAELEDVAIAFGLHPLAVEDAINAHQRPKLERYEDTLFLVLKTLWYVDADRPGGDRRDQPLRRATTSWSRSGTAPAAG